MTLAIILYIVVGILLGVFIRVDATDEQPTPELDFGLRVFAGIFWPGLFLFALVLFFAGRKERL